MRRRRQAAILRGMDAHTTRFIVTVFVALSCTLVAICAQAGEPRSPAAGAEFLRANPCSATGATTGRCRNGQLDQREVPACGEQDIVWSPRWLPIAEQRQDKPCRRR
jgi:hypothetical protein